MVYTVQESSLPNLALFKLRAFCLTIHSPSISMAEASWQETLRLRLVERNNRECAFAPIIEQCTSLSYPGCILSDFWTRPETGFADKIVEGTECTTLRGRSCNKRSGKSLRFRRRVRIVNSIVGSLAHQFTVTQFVLLIPRRSKPRFHLYATSLPICTKLRGRTLSDSYP
jgi:hypothetical protein